MATRPQEIAEAQKRIEALEAERGVEKARADENEVLFKTACGMLDDLTARLGKQTGRAVGQGEEFYTRKSIADHLAKARGGASLEDAMLDAYNRPQQGYADVTHLMIDGMSEAAKERRAKA